MKLEDIAPHTRTHTKPVKTATSPRDDYGSERNAAHPEIAELLNARTANMLFNCGLARDEIELVNFIINKLVNPLYVPSESLLQAIRTVNVKIGGTDSMHGMVRTA